MPATREDWAEWRRIVAGYERLHARVAKAASAFPIASDMAWDALDDLEDAGAKIRRCVSAVDEELGRLDGAEAGDLDADGEAIPYP